MVYTTVQEIIKPISPPLNSPNYKKLRGKKLLPIIPYKQLNQTDYRITPNSSNCNKSAKKKHSFPYNPRNNQPISSKFTELQKIRGKKSFPTRIILLVYKELRKVLTERNNQTIKEHENHSVSIEVQERVGGNEVGEVIGFCKLFQSLLEVIPRAERE